MTKRLKIVKIGGNIINSETALNRFLKDFSALENPKILVHGGGRKATEVSKTLGVNSLMHNGRRITDASSLEVTVMVYAGLINKKIVAALQAMQSNALGVSGADANLIQSRKRPVKEVDFGFVGDVEQVNAQMILKLLEAGLVPVFSAITHDGKGQLLNTNADTIAAELAVALAEKTAVELIYIFEKDGVLKNVQQNEVIEQLDWETYQSLKQQKVILDGMIPKLDNCFYALQNGVKKVVIGGEKLLSDSGQKYTQVVLDE